MLRFKEMGVSRYDWGGLFQDESTPERAGINAFKKSFGGTVELTYECTVPLTVKGRMYLPLRDAWHSWKPVLWARNASTKSA
jgi:lipid II:glycine glycyltransferase (peptidoglycan interpeptide bridge formation enzyme)